MQFVNASYYDYSTNEIFPGICMVQGKHVIYIGQSEPGENSQWWFWQFEVDDEDSVRLSTIMSDDKLTSKYETRGYSECGFDSFAECVKWAFDGWKAKKKKKYRVELTQTVEVEAMDEYEATEIAQDMMIDSWNCYIEEVEE